MNDVDFVRRWFGRIRNFPGNTLKMGSQDLEPYWDENFVAELEAWGNGTVWDEIQYFFAGREGIVLDIACGTGKTIEILSKNKNIEFHGCDISDLLIAKAVAKGITKENLSVCDATKMNYADEQFDYSYSIGSLEHFTEEGIARCIAESSRVTKRVSFHMVPVSKSGKNQGWIKRVQSYHNNSTEWWLTKFTASYPDVLVLDSRWKDSISDGKWFVGIKQGS